MEEARQEYEEALRIRRELAQKNPETYLPDLAWTLHNLGLLDYSQKRVEEARQEYQEGLKIYRELAQKDPQTYLPYVAMTLYNLGRPIEAGAVLLSMYQSSWPLLATMAGVPLALLAVVGLLSSRLRRSVASSMRESEGHTLVSVAPAMTVSCELVLHRLDASEVKPATGQEVIALSEAEATTRDTRFAYTAAAIAYTVVTTFAVSTSLAATNPDWSTALLVVFVYMMQWVPLLIWVWFLGISGRLRLAILAGYLVLGLLLAPLDSRAAAMAVISTLPISVLFPMGLLLLLARPLRPWLLVLVAYLLFSIAGGVALLHLLPLPRKPVWSLVRPWQLGASVMFDVLAVALLGWTLCRRRWQLPVACLSLLAGASLLTMWLLPNSDVGTVLGALPSKTLQAFIVWLLFKLFALVQQREFLPAQMLHSHLCWGFLTIYLLVMTMGGAVVFGGHGWLPWAIVLAFALYLFMVHWLSRRIWAARVGRQGKRLLFLRVFGSADKRETLLDELDDTWRRVGRLDLIAGTDLAMRTLGSRMLEAFLLRRTQEHFLKTDADVDRRLGHLPSRLQADARYPVNPVYCYATAWQRSVTRLAPEADAVLMDLRGFTGRNQGCIFELTWLVQQVLLSRIVLLTDQTTDHEVMEQVVTKAWADLPCTSPNAVDRKPVITVLNAIRRSNDNRRALFTLLLRATYSPYGISGC